MTSRGIHRHLAFTAMALVVWAGVLAGCGGDDFDDAVEEALSCTASDTCEVVAGLACSCAVVVRADGVASVRAADAESDCDSSELPRCPAVGEPRCEEGVCVAR